MRVLVVHDDGTMRARARAFLLAARHEVAEAVCDDAARRYDIFQPEVVVCNLDRPSQAEMRALGVLSSRNPRIGFVGLTDSGQPDAPLLGSSAAERRSQASS